MPNGICPFAVQVQGLQENVCWARGYVDRVGFCDHTAGGYYGTLISAAFWNGSGVSAHFAIAKDGRIAQLVNIFDTAFAQGRLGPQVIWPPYQSMNSQNPNGYLISTEHEDATETNMIWPEAMYDSDLRVKRWCIEEAARVRAFNLLKFDIDSLAGHYMFDQVNRPYCPGNGWPRKRLYDDLTNNDVGATDMFVAHNAWPSYFQGLRIAKGQEAWANILADFKFPDARSYQLEFLVKHGFVEIYHGSGLIAKRMGWTTQGIPYSDEVHVIPTDDTFVGPGGIAGKGWIKLKAGNAEDVEFQGASALGYWT